MNKILSIIISYHPDNERLKENVDAFIDFVDTIIIWENMLTDEVHKYRCISHPKINYHCENGNKGISYALNYAMEYAKREGYDYILTMDQDSVFEGFADYKQACLKKYEQENCLIGPLVNKSINSNPSFQYPEDINIITSGMLVPTKVLDCLGGYNKSFFVDGIDIELCMRALHNAMKVYQYTGANLNQRFGEHKAVKLFNKELLLRNYSANRLFEIVKNNVVIFRNYKNAKFLKRILWYYFFIHPFLILFYENDKYNKIRSIYCGFYKGIKETSK